LIILYNYYSVKITFLLKLLYPKIKVNFRKLKQKNPIQPKQINLKKHVLFSSKLNKKNPFLSLENVAKINYIAELRIIVV
jgi:ppGpp synthetase/RelA/SpoT-type nucleotidyltranferase